MLTRVLWCARAVAAMHGNRLARLCAEHETISSATGCEADGAGLIADRNEQKIG